MPKTAACFVHVEKSAGTAVIHLLRDLYGETHVLQINGPRHRQIALDALLERHPVVTGHFIFAQLTPVVRERAFVFTFLREPIDRVLSQYYYYRQKLEEGNPTVDRVQRAGLEEIIDELGESRWSSVWSNWQTYVFSDATNLGQQTAEEMLPAALRNLEQLDFVGIHAAFNEGVRCLGRQFGWPEGTMPASINVTAVRPKVEQIAPGLRARLDRINTCDAVLYARACELWEAAKARSTARTVNLAATTGEQSVNRRRERGTREIFFSGVRVYDERTLAEGRVEHGGTLRVEVRGRSTVSADGLSVEIRLRDVLGVEIYGLSTRLLGRSLVFAAGNDFQVDIACRTILGTGRYYLSVAVLGGEYGERCYHRIDNALLFECWHPREVEFTGVVDLGASLEVRAGSGAEPMDGAVR